MSVLKISSRYAKSLITLAVEQNVLDAVYQDMVGFREIAGMREFALFIKSPVIKSAKKIKILELIFDGKVHPLTMAFLRIMTGKGREEYLVEISDQFVRQYKELKGISTVQVTSAKALTSEHKEAIRKALSGHERIHEHIEIEEKTDASLIGGLIIQMEDQKYDASISGKLHQMRKSLSKS